MARYVHVTKYARQNDGLTKLTNKGLYTMTTAIYCKESGFYYVVGYVTGYKYWGHNAYAAKQKAAMYFYR